MGGMFGVCGCSRGGGQRLLVSRFYCAPLWWIYLSNIVRRPMLSHEAGFKGLHVGWT